MSKIKLLLINSVVGYGATGRITEDLAKSEEVYSLVCYGRKSYTGKVNTYKFSNKFDNATALFKASLTDNCLDTCSYSTEKLIEKIKDFDPDIIHIHNLHGYYLNVEKLFKFLKVYNKPIVWTFHDCWPFTGHCAYFDMIGCTKWKTGCFNCPKKLEYPPSLLIDNSKNNWLRKKELFNGLDITIVTPSKWLSKIVKDSFLGNYRIEVINNGIDIDTFKPTSSNFKEKNNISNKTMILGVASEWTKRKGFNDFLKIRELLDDSYVMVMVGLNQKQLSCLPNGIIGIKRTTSKSELAEVYSAADVFLNTTYEDNYPTVNLEAIACGTPVITYKTGGSPETIDNKTGIIIEQGNYLEVANTIKELKLNNAFSTEDFVNRFKQLSKEEMVNNYVSLYRDILKSQK